MKYTLVRDVAVLRGIYCIWNLRLSPYQPISTSHFQRQQAHQSSLDPRGSFRDIFTGEAMHAEQSLPPDSPVLNSNTLSKGLSPSNQIVQTDHYRISRFYLFSHSSTLLPLPNQNVSFQ